MTPIHGMVIVVAMIVPALCGLSHQCSDSLKEIITFCTLVAVGVLGNARDNAKKIDAPKE